MLFLLQDLTMGKDLYFCILECCVMKKDVEQKQYCGGLSRMYEQFHGDVPLWGFVCGGREDEGEGEIDMWMYYFF